MPRFDRRRFLLAWLRAPLRIASITPSAPRLAGLMTKEISALTGPVLELGPGTGVFTSALLERGIAERDLTLIEYERDFATLLQDRFPDARVLQLDVREMWKTALSRSFFGGVVSGLLRPKMPGAHRNPRLPRSRLKEDRLDPAQYPAGCGLSHQPQVSANGPDRAAPCMMMDTILCYEAGDLAFDALRLLRASLR
ncbi:class I SAM-dependent methyltransferase (plasmid) [Rhizobium leguminosarum]